MITSTDCSGSLPSKNHSVPSARSLAAKAEATYDANLVERFNTGDEAAFNEIVTRYRERLFSIALSLLKNRADADEMVQDTFIRAHRGLGKFRGDSSLSTWLHRITTNLSRNRYWYNFRRRQHATWSLDSAFSDDNPSTFAHLVASDTASPVQEVGITEFSQLVATCMARLCAANQDILTRRNILNCSYGEIAQAIGISLGTVKSRIARARHNLRFQITKACPEFAANTSPNTWLDSERRPGCLEAICA